jgi:hypothetical protein
MFQWDVLTAYVLFIDPADLEGTWQYLRCLVAPRGWPERMIARALGNRGGVFPIFGLLKRANK